MGSSGNMLSTRRLYRGRKAEQQQHTRVGMATRARRARRRPGTQRGSASRVDRSMTAEARPRTPRRGEGRIAERADADRV